MAENTQHERHVGRRPLDSAHVLKWVPVLSLGALLLLQTIYVTRNYGGIESNVALLLTANAKLEAKVEALTAAVAQGSVPNAQAQLRLEFLERQANENRQSVADVLRQITQLDARNADVVRQLTALELRFRAARER